MKDKSVYYLLFISISIFLLQSCRKEQDVINKIKTDLCIDTLLSRSNKTELSSNVRISNADSAIILARESKNDSILFNAFKNKVNLLDELGDNNSSFKFNHEVKDWALNHSDKKYLASAYFNLGNYFYYNYKSDSAYYYFNKSKDLYRTLKDKEGLTKNSINIAMILNDVASYFQSEKSSLEALEYIKKEPNHPYLTPIYNNLAVSSGSLLNYKEELYWYDKALALTDDPYYTASIKHNKGVAYILLKEYDKAIAIFSSIQNDAIVNENLGLKARIIDNLSYAKWRKNNNENVINGYDEAVAIFNKIEDYFGLSTTLDHLIEYYKEKDPEKALNYAKEKYNITKKSNNTEGRLNSLKQIISLNPDKNNIKEYISLSDSLQHLNSNSKYQFAKLEFDVDANREKVTFLTLENTQKELKLEQAKLSIIITVAIIVIGIILFIFYFYYIRQKRKQELIKATYDTEVALSQKLHDELANDLFSTLTLVDSIPFNNDQVKGKLIHNLNHIYSQTRRISRENNTIDLANFKSELDTMLGSYKSDDVNIITRGIEDILWHRKEDEVKYVIYRVLMEFMINMKKHSNCSLVVIKFEKEGKNLIINYVDNGTGIDISEYSKRNGIKNVENRIKGINGTINFDFTKGYRVTLTIPV